MSEGIRLCHFSLGIVFAITFLVSEKARKCEIQDSDGCYISFYAGENDKGNFTIWASPEKSKHPPSHDFLVE